MHGQQNIKICSIHVSYLILLFYALPSVLLFYLQRDLNCCNNNNNSNNTDTNSIRYAIYIINILV